MELLAVTGSGFYDIQKYNQGRHKCYQSKNQMLKLMTVTETLIIPDIIIVELDLTMIY